MNRIYKVVWCHVRNTYVVASELASRKKIKSSTGSSAVLQLGAVLTMSSILGTTSAFAAGEIDLGYVEPGSESVAIGINSQATGTASIAIGRSASANGNGAFAIGRQANAQGSGSIGIGQQAVSSDMGTAIGAQSRAGNSATAIGTLTEATGHHSLAAGRESKASGEQSVALGIASSASAFGAVAIGADSKATNEYEVSFGHSGLKRKLTFVEKGAVNAASTDAINGSQLYTTNQNVSYNRTSVEGLAKALGAGASIGATGVLTSPNFKIALGTTTNINTVEDGFKHLTSRINNLPAGGGSSNSGDQVVILANRQVVLNPSVVQEDVSLVLGYGATAEATDYLGQPTTNYTSIVLGNKATTTASRSVAIGDGSISTLDSVVMGSQAKALGESNMVIIGAGAEGTHRGSTAIGWHSKSQESGATAIGVSTEALGNYSTAIGASARSEGGLSVAIGNHATTGSYAYGTVALGYKAQVDAYQSVAIGGESVATEEQTVSFGRLAKEGENEDLTRRLVNVSKGKISEKSTDAINGSQLYLSNKATVDALGGESKLDDKGNISGPTYTLVDKDGQDNATKDFHNVGDALGNLDGRINTNVTNIAGNTTIINSILKGEKGIIQVASDGKSLVVDNSIAGNAISFNFSNTDDQGQVVDRTLTGVAKGQLDNDAVNVAQLKEVDTKVDGNTTLINSQGDKITNITKKQGNSLTGIEKAFGGSAAFDSDGNLTMPNYKTALDADKDLNSVYDGFEYVNSKLTGIAAGAAGLIKLSGDGKSLVVDNVLAQDAKSFDISNVDAQGQAVDRTLTGVAAGKLDNDAVNVGQLNKVDGKVDAGLNFVGNDATKEINKKLGDTLTIKGGLADGEKATSENLRVDVEGGELVVKMSSELKGLTDILFFSGFINWRTSRHLHFKMDSRTSNHARSPRCDECCLA